MPFKEERGAALAKPAGIPGQIERWLKANHRQVEALLPASLDFKRLARTTIQAIQEVPDLAKCTPQSVLGGILAAAQLGLVLGKAQKQAYLLPFRDKNGVYKAEFVRGVPGLITLAARSGVIARAGFTVKDQNLFFDEAAGRLSVGQPPEAVDIYEEQLAWAWALWYPLTMPQATVIKVWSRATVEGRRKRGKNPDGPAWQGSNYNEMATTRILGAVLKNAPLDPTGTGLDALVHSDGVVNIGEGKLDVDSSDGLGIIDYPTEPEPEPEVAP